jgi:hypothetical protein
MRETRAALAHKVESLEDRVNGTLQDVSDTVADVGEAVRNAVQSVRDSVEDGLEALYNALDIKRQTARHPGLMFGGSIALGALGGYLLGRSNVASRREPTRLPAPTPYGATEQRESSAATPLRDPGWLDEIAARFRPELEDLKGLAIGTSLGLLRDAIARSLPEVLGPKVTELMDKITVKLGGYPVRESVLEDRRVRH